MIVAYKYAGNVERDGAPCPLCGGEVKMRPASGQHDLHSFYCDRCKVEFTIGERIRDYEEERVRNMYLDEAIDRWDVRDGDDPDRCPFCGEEVGYDFMHSSLFDSLECPSCRMRFQFQSHPRSRGSLERTMREFRSRPGSV